MSGVTGQQLYDELGVAAANAGISLNKFISPLCTGRDRSWKLEQLRIAKIPTQLTIDRVRSLIAGRPIPPARGSYQRDARAFGLSRADAEDAGIPPSSRSVNEGHTLARVAIEKARVEQLRDWTEIAHATRAPGQTVADRVQELRRESHA